MTVLATDDFTRANEDPLSQGGNWADFAGSEDAFKIVSNLAVPQNNGVDACSYYTGVTWPDDQYVEVTVFNLTTGAESGVGAALRVADSSNHYRIVVSSDASNNVSIAKRQSNSYSLITTRTQAFSDGDTFRAEIQGTTIRVYRNGVQLGADISDAGTTLLAGDAGIFESSNVTASTGLGSFVGGDLSGSGTTVTATVAAATASSVEPPRPRPANPFSEINVRL